MSITVTCPGCGAPMQVAGDARSITCTFCGNHFSVDLESTTPELQRADAPAPTQDIPGAPQPDMGTQNPNELYNPPLTGEIVSHPYTPTTDTSSGFAGANTPPGYSSPDEPQPDFYKTVFEQGKNTLMQGRLLGNRLWVTIAIAVSSIFCVSCLCMILIIQLFRR